MRLSEIKTTVQAMMAVNIAAASVEGADLSNALIVPMMESVPGVGKTSAVAQVAKEMSAVLRTVRLSDREPTDVTGWHVPNEDNTAMRHIRPDWLPHADAPLTFVFFDEIAQGATAAQNTVAQCVNERKVGEYEVHPNTFFICAGNAAKDRAGTNHMPTHLRDRLTWFTVDANAEDTAAHFSERGFDTRLVAYLRFRSEMLSRFDKDAKACPSPRSWEKVNTVLKAALPYHLRLQAIAGNVGDGAANDFTGYLRLVEAVPDMDKLIADPKNAPLPTDLGILYAVATELSARFTTGNADNIMAYLDRLPQQDIAAFVVTDIARKHGRSIQQIRSVMDRLVKIGTQLSK